MKVRLHIGSGDKIWPSFINCDLHSEADVNTDGRTLPFPADYADEIHSIHFVEHVPRMDVQNMFSNWHKIMKKYRVKVLGVQGINNRVYVANEIVTEENFPEGNAAILVKDGKLEEIWSKQEERESEEIQSKPVQKAKSSNDTK